MNYPEQMTSHFLCCQVCKEPGYRDPRMLKCGHTFCAGCLQNHASEMNISCPLCHLVTPLPKGGIQNLHHNRFIDCQVDRLLRRHNKVLGRDDTHYYITNFGQQKTGFAYLNN